MSLLAMQDWTEHLMRVLMAQGLALRAKDREVPGSIPTQD